MRRIRVAVASKRLPPQGSRGVGRGVAVAVTVTLLAGGYEDFPSVSRAVQVGSEVPSAVARATVTRPSSTVTVVLVFFR